MNEDLRARLETYHEADQYEEIVETIEGIPAEERDYEVVSHLGRALNNLKRYEEAAAQFLTVAEEGQDDPLWHYRLGLAYYYLEQYEEAKREFTLADKLDPGDEDTLEFLEWIEGKIAQGTAADSADLEGDNETGADAVSLSAAEQGTAEADGELPSGIPAAVSENGVMPGDSAAITDGADLLTSSAGSKDPLSAGFWQDSPEALEKYVLAAPAEELIASVEEELVFKLPSFYVQMMKIHNGGIPYSRVYPVQQGDAEEKVVLSAILGIGRDKSHSLCGELGSRYQIEKEGYPEFGIVIAECQDEHQAVMLDYREAGNDGEPEVVWVNKAGTTRITRLAPDFETFVRGLV